MGYKTLYNSPNDCTENTCSQSAKSNSQSSIFFVFQINGVSASERRFDRQAKYSGPSVSLGDWLQKPLQVPESMDAHEPCIKRLALLALRGPASHVR